MNITDIAVEYTLSPAEIDHITIAAARLRTCQESPRSPDFYEINWSLHRELPDGLTRFLDRFRRTEPAAACIVHGFPVDDAAAGPTPGHWADAIDAPTTTHELFMSMCAVTVGEPFTWSTLQSGSMIQNIFPIKGDETRQSGHGSEALLEFHTEDGFHPGRCDYLMLFGVRNHDAVPTLLASVRDVDLTEEQRELLAQPLFHIVPDDEHVRQLMTRFPDHPALAKAQRMQQDPEAVPVLFGDRLHPYLRIDRPFMHSADDDPVANGALDALIAELERVTFPVVVHSGSLVIVDNYVAVHGRRAFAGRYDGTDRWLKRMIVSRDLRKAPVGSVAGNRRVLF